MENNELSAVLTFLEKVETPLLRWGVVDHFFTEEELTELLETFLDEKDFSIYPEELIDELLDKGLIYETLEGERFRTRMSETVRLASELRQLAHSKHWTEGRSLVSDFRFLNRERSVPKRSMPAQDAISSLKSAKNLEINTELEEALKTVLGDLVINDFQYRSTERLLSEVDSDRISATCITAGTGAGKTFAFYIAALSFALSTRRETKTPSTVALYPRTELLRDQVKTITELVSRIDDTHISIGVLYGSSPKNRIDAENSVHDTRRWSKTADGLKCPILNCINEDCNEGSLIWPTDVNERNILRCVQCGEEVHNLVFTRDQLAKDGCDIFFSTFETLNWHLQGPLRHLFAGEPESPPKFVLLDEIHTYAGTHGAQVALLFRRYQQKLWPRKFTHIVGLSATLYDPVSFFTSFTGLNETSVQIIAPKQEELVEVSNEYLLVLRGDPASKTALASTTIQTAMLMRRMLDYDQIKPSESMYGSKLFIFTDKLDSVNRLHTQLLNAEGWQQSGANAIHKSRAILRKSGKEDKQRDINGQLWKFAEGIETLEKPIRVGRTSSQDAGVQEDADIIVASASLEVGFDDPTVGAILQHKAPRGNAQFLQRKGRAGRNPLMRPWTVVVLSDFGRDRVTFQSYEKLLDPVLSPIQLPINNRTIQKMQATWWLIDELSTKIKPNLRNVFRAPLLDQKNKISENEIEIIIAEINSFFTKEGLKEISRKLCYALGLNDENEVLPILWSYPRGLISSVLPSFLSHFQTLQNTDLLDDDYQTSDPTEEFIPSALFNSLQTPEVKVSWEFNEIPKDDMRSITKVMSTYSPGTVSYNDALRGKGQRLWVEPPSLGDETLEIGDFCNNYRPISDVTYDDNLTIYQPLELTLSVPGFEIPDAMKSMWNWESRYQETGFTIDYDLPVGSNWSKLVTEFSGMLHRGNSPLKITRYAESFSFADREYAPDPSTLTYPLSNNGSPAALGFSYEADAVKLKFSLPDLNQIVKNHEPLERALRSTQASIRIHESVIICSETSFWQRNWIAELLFSGLVFLSLQNKEFEEFTSATLIDAMLTSAVEVFKFDIAEDENEENLLTEDKNSREDYFKELKAILDTPEIADEILSIARELLDRRIDYESEWIHTKFLSTLCSALTHSIQTLCPEIDAESLLPDYEILFDDNSAVIRIVENEPGGLGVIEAFTNEYLKDPRIYWNLVSETLGPCDGERIDQNLQIFLSESIEGSFSDEVSSIRESSHLQELSNSWKRLRSAMHEKGLQSDPSIIAAISTRFLRQGSKEELPSFTNDLLSDWLNIELQLGFEIDLRVFSYTASQDDSRVESLKSLIGIEDISKDQIQSQIMGLLWPRGSTSRSTGLKTYNPFIDLSSSERLLFDFLTDEKESVVKYESDDDRREIDEHLKKTGTCLVQCKDNHEATRLFTNLLLTPTEYEVIHIYPRITGVKRNKNNWEISLEIREELQ